MAFGVEAVGGGDVVDADRAERVAQFIDLGAEVDELCDALGSIGIDDVSTADGFDAEGHPEGAQPYPPA